LLALHIFFVTNHRMHLTKIASIASFTWFVATYSTLAAQHVSQTNSLGMVFVEVPRMAVAFSMWETRIQDYAVFVAEGHWARLWTRKPDFPQGTNHPVVNVGWEDAKNFCVWLTKREHDSGHLKKHQVYRLPTDREWSAVVGLPREIGQPRNPVMLVRSVTTRGESTGRIHHHALIAGFLNTRATKPLSFMKIWEQLGGGDGVGYVLKGCEAELHAPARIFMRPESSGPLRRHAFQVDLPSVGRPARNREETPSRTTPSGVRRTPELAKITNTIHDYWRAKNSRKTSSGLATEIPDSSL
jgi:hypothetical protein